MTSESGALLIAFIAGILTFFSPCILPLIPSYLCYITGFSADELKQRDNRKVIMSSLLNSCFFVVGFSFVFISLGISASLLGRFLVQIADLLRLIGGLVIIFFGLIISGIFKFSFMNIEKRFTIRNKPLGYAGAVLVGMAFSFGWVPCVGPILSSILVAAGTSHNIAEGIVLLAAYSLGLGIPIMITSVAFNYSLTFIGRISNYVGLISKISGILLIILGLLVMGDSLNYLMRIISPLFKFRGI